MNRIYRIQIPLCLRSIHFSYSSNFPHHTFRTITHPGLRNDPTPDRGSQLPRAASLIISSLGFVHDLRAGLLPPDTVRGTPLDMTQYCRLFGTSRIPTEVRPFNQM